MADWTFEFPALGRLGGSEGGVGGLKMRYYFRITFIVTVDND